MAAQCYSFVLHVHQNKPGLILNSHLPLLINTDWTTSPSRAMLWAKHTTVFNWCPKNIAGLWKTPGEVWLANTKKAREKSPNLLSLFRPSNDFKKNNRWHVLTAIFWISEKVKLQTRKWVASLSLTSKHLKLKASQKATHGRGLITVWQIDYFRCAAL